MSSRSVIELDNVSKSYKLGSINTSSLSEDIKLWFKNRSNVLAKSIVNDPSAHLNQDARIVWSLKDVSFSIGEGETLGVIGRNGAGKSTLLKLISRITSPTYGEIRIKGKLASLLEVGTGFHPDLTGRENIFLNGAILGMSRNEIKKKFDEIVDFAGVEKYIDTPVKRYSSGMYVRLAFAVAAHLESDILIVDEVLAVGDAEFQKKCMTKMNQMGNSQGKTILFVSHNMSSIKSLCKKALFLEKGGVRNFGESDKVITDYLSAYTPPSSNSYKIEKGTSLHGTGEARFVSLQIFNNGALNNTFNFGDNPSLKLFIDVEKNIDDVVVGVHFINSFGEKIFMLTPNQSYEPISLNPGKYEIDITISEVLMPGEYSLGLVLTRFHSGADIDYIESIGKLVFLKESSDSKIIYPWATVHGYIKPRSQWNIKHLGSATNK